jgi:chitinase
MSADVRGRDDSRHQSAWVNNVAYVSGDEASRNGDNWTDNQRNDDEVPGGAC